jgi:hypothetical protein
VTGPILDLIKGGIQIDVTNATMSTIISLRILLSSFHVLTRTIYDDPRYTLYPVCALSNVVGHSVLLGVQRTGRAYCTAISS